MKGINQASVGIFSIIDSLIPNLEYPVFLLLPKRALNASVGLSNKYLSFPSALTQSSVKVPISQISNLNERGLILSFLNIQLQSAHLSVACSDGW